METVFDGIIYNNEYNESCIKFPDPEMSYINEYFYIFDDRISILKEYFGYNVHVYSNKEVRELRKKKVQTSIYSSIIFNKDFDKNDDTVSLILEKNGSKKVKTPFIYLDYFILRLTDMLTVKNTEKYLSLKSTEVIKREFKLTTKAFEYYRYIYNFGQFETVYIDYRKKKTRDFKEDAEFERECQKTREAYSEYVLETIKQQIRESDLRKKEKLDIERGKLNKEYIKPVNRWKNQADFLNDLEKELGKPDYCIAYEYLRVHVPPEIHNIFYNEHYERVKHLEKIVMLAIKEINKNKVLGERDNEQNRTRVRSLEKKVLYS